MLKTFNKFLKYKKKICLETISKYHEHSSIEPFHQVPNKNPVWLTADEAVSIITSGMRVFIHGSSATPSVLIEAMTKHGKAARLNNVEIIHIHTDGPALYAQKEYEGIFRNNSLFIGHNCRQAVNEGRADFTPIFLSEVPLLFRRRVINLDVALIHVSPPDVHGFCSLGTAVDTTRAAIQNAKYIIGQVNPNMPRTFGDGMIHQSNFDSMVEVNAIMPEREMSEATPAEEKIARFISENLVLDGATLQMGIGSIPDAVLSQLKNHKDLGIHSEMFSDGILPLVESGSLTNAKKNLQTGKIVAGFAYGSRKLYNFMHDNPLVLMCDIAWVNNTFNIAQNPRVTAINSCIEVDLTGQVVSDSIGMKMYSGVGGQVDFLRGATLCTDGLGKAILAVPSITSKGISRIVPVIKEGAGVVTTRAHVHYIVTEFGYTNLFGKNLRQRAYELIRIAHPDHREKLERAAFERLKIMPSI